MGLVGLLVGNDNKRSIKKLSKIADKIEALSDKYKGMSDEELRGMTEVFKRRLTEGETLNDILPDAFATVREASGRVLGMRHFYCQLLGGIALHQGRIAQMSTGEGKTLVATLPAYLNSLTGKGVHVVTVNEYLTKTQAIQMGILYDYLGVSVGIILSDMHPQIKRNAYNCDITYATNNELGFDYLRDNMVNRREDRVQREFNFAIVDEVDSILIDEARTPLIISGKGMKPTDAYIVADKFAKGLASEGFEINEERKTIILTEEGAEMAEKYFNIENIADVENMELNHNINNALRARYMMKLDSNYMIQNGEVIIVDEYTGRAMPGRRFSEGLHQAIEAKEGVKILEENKTLAMITFQNYFRLYKKLSGMTGTAKTEEVEFNKIYNLDVVELPTNMPMIRKDYNDKIYKTHDAKIKAVVDEIERIHSTGQPILVGTTTIERSEELSIALKRRHIPHHVLNAKSLEREAEIVAQAGRLGRVTVSTNMAGRGTDILLGGNPDFLAVDQLKKENYNDEQINIAKSWAKQKSDEIKEIEKKYRRYLQDFQNITNEEKKKVVELGGLHVIGTERHESRRIDNQLRGRSGRQGDPGSSVFFASMKDDLLRKFGGETMFRLAEFFKIDDDIPIQVGMISKGIEKAQKKIEGINFASRKHVLEFDDILNIQRFQIYKQRNEVLDGINVHEQIVEMIRSSAYNIVKQNLDYDKAYFDWDLHTLNMALEDSILIKGYNLVNEAFVENCEIDDVAEKVAQHIVDILDAKVKDAKEVGYDFSILERNLLLRTVDRHWMDHIDAMNILKNEIMLQSFAQRDPVSAYKRESGRMFDNMIEKIWEDITRAMFTVRIERVEMKKPVFANPKVVKEATPIAKNVVGRNDPCPCGSGKKYKNCCGKG